MRNKVQKLSPKSQVPTCQFPHVLSVPVGRAAPLRLTAPDLLRC